MSRYKRVIGDTLHSRTEPGQATEVAIAVHALNRSGLHSPPLAA